MPSIVKKNNEQINRQRWLIHLETMNLLDSKDALLKFTIYLKDFGSGQGYAFEDLLRCVECLMLERIELVQDDVQSSTMPTISRCDHAAEGALKLWVFREVALLILRKRR